MQPYQRVITQLLLQELFDENGPVTAERQRDLSKEVIQELLRTRVNSSLLTSARSRSGCLRPTALHSGKLKLARTLPIPKPGTSWKTTRVVTATLHRNGCLQ